MKEYEKKIGQYKRKVRRRRAIKVILILAVVAGVLGGTYYLLKRHTVDSVTVEGNLHYTSAEIQEMVMKGPLGGNSLYLSLAYKDKVIRDVPFIASMSVEVVDPKTVRIHVYEKTLAGYVEYLGRYVYFDNDGTVVEISNIKTEGIPHITGLSFEHVVLEKPLPVEDAGIFERILGMTKTLKKYNLVTDTIRFESSDTMVLTFGKIRVKFGTDSKAEEKMQLLTELLPELSGKSGTLNMENYESGSTVVSFLPDT